LQKGRGLKKIKRLIYIENVNETFNKKKPIEHTVEVNIYYQEHKERMEIDVIGGQKWNIILEILWLAYHNPEINLKTGEVKMTRCLDECRKKIKVKAGKTRVAKVKE